MKINIYLLFINKYIRFKKEKRKQNQKRGQKAENALLLKKKEKTCPFGGKFFLFVRYSEKFEGGQEMTQKEALFCMEYAYRGNAREAAIHAGFRLHPESSGMRLLKREEIRLEIARIQKERYESGEQERIRLGYERLAFGNTADAVQLLYLEEPTKEILEQMDLFQISEMKRLKGGGVEIKFYDRMKALQCMEQMAQVRGAEQGDFYRALERASATIEGEEAD